MKRKHSVWLLVLCLFACQPKPDHSNDLPAQFDCATGSPGWVRATAISPNLLAPCETGSAGICPARFRYQSGTGWCRPR